MKTTYFEGLKPKLIYVFRINDGAHKGCLKIGETTMDVDPDEIDVTTILPDSKTLNKAARERISQYTATAGIAYELLYTESASYRKGSRTIGFNDKDVLTPTARYKSLPVCHVFSAKLKTTEAQRQALGSDEVYV